MLKTYRNMAEQYLDNNKCDYISLLGRYGDIEKFQKKYSIKHAPLPPNNKKLISKIDDILVLLKNTE
jgi:hypothetical protein